MKKICLLEITRAHAHPLSTEEKYQSDIYPHNPPATMLNFHDFNRSLLSVHHVLLTDIIQIGLDDALQ